MQNDFFQKFLKVSIMVAILLAGVSAFYYFVIFLPQQQRQCQKYYFNSQDNNSINSQIEKQERDFLFSMKQECQKAGDKLYQADVKSLGVKYLFIPEYAYSKSLNTCLYFGGYFKDGMEMWVKDSFTNKVIISFMRFGEEIILGSTCPSCLSGESFNEKKHELFNE